MYIIAPHKERTFDKERPRSTLAELIERHDTGNYPAPIVDHYTVWITEDFVELIHWLGWNILHVQDTDDKVGNGFAVVVQVAKDNAPKLNVAATVAKQSVSPLQPAWANPQRFTPAAQPSLAGPAVDQLNKLQRENAQLRRAIADLIVEKQILKDMAQGHV